MVARLTRALLHAFRSLPPEGAVEAAELPLRGGRLERLRLARRMEELHLAKAVRQRPKVIQVRPDPFPGALHALLNDRTDLMDLLKDHGLLIIGILSTSPDPLDLPEISRLAGLHTNTTRPIMDRLRRRAYLARSASGFSIADDALDLHRLGSLYMDHLQQSLLEDRPTFFPVKLQYGRLVIRSTKPMPGLPSTGASYFQQAGAEVLAKAYLHASVPSGAPITMKDAFLDFLATNPPPRTRKAVERFVEERRKHAD